MQIDTAKMFAPAVFLGFKIDPKKSNPYAPSAVQLSFAIANSSRRIDMPMSGEFGEKIYACKSESYSINDNYIEQWQTLSAKSNKDRVTRYILTGNLLQTLSSEAYKSGQIINYTVKSGGVMKGYLLPEGWQPMSANRYGNKTENKIAVPVYMAKDYIKQNASQRNFINTTDVMDFGRHYDNLFTLIVPASKSQGGKFFQDLVLVKMTVGENFNKSGNLMIAKVEENNIDNVLEYLQNERKLNILMEKEAFEQIKNIIPEGSIPEAQKQSLPKPIVIEESEQTYTETIITETPKLNLTLIKIKAKAARAKLLLQEQSLSGTKKKNYYVIETHPQYVEELGKAAEESKTKRRWKFPTDYLPEIKVSIVKPEREFKLDNPKITSSGKAHEALQLIYHPELIEYKEYFFILYLDRANNIKAWQKVSEGGRTGTFVDVGQIVATAVKLNMSGVVIAHNHPSGALIPSEPDKKITQTLKEALRLVDVSLLDHIIMTKKGYFSFADDGVL
jgi:DNA repair protein RadC